MTLHMYVVPTQMKGCCQNLRLIRIFCYITFGLKVGVCSEIRVFTPMVPPSQILIKSQSYQKMPLIFSLRIVNSWLHTKFRWPMSIHSESRAHSSLCSRSKSYFNENSGLVHYLLCTELYSQNLCWKPHIDRRRCSWSTFSGNHIIFWVTLPLHKIKFVSGWNFLLFLMV